MPVVSAYPILVAPNNDSSYTIIDGCKRFASMSAAQTSVQCLIAGNDQTSLTSGFLRIILNISRTLSLSEKVLFVKWLHSHCNESLYMSIANRPPFTLKECREIERIVTITPELLALIESNSLDISVAQDFLALDSQSKDAIMELFTALQFSRSTQRELIDWLPEIAYTKKTTVHELTDSPEVDAIVSHQTLNAPQKVQKIRDYFYAIRYPMLISIKEEWQALARKINPLPSRCQFIPSEAFERNRLEIKLTVTKHEEIELLLEKLKNIPPEQWDKLIYPAIERC
jgi:HEPN domain-containing protein